MVDYFFDPTVARYIRERLAEETAERGRPARIADATGFTREHIAAVASGVRKAGRDLANVIGKYWGLTQPELVRVAHEKYDAEAPKPVPKSHPELEAMLAFCKPLYPQGFLVAFEAKARSGPDRPRLDWYSELQSQFRAWLADQPESVQLTAARLVCRG